jgi:NAD(P) transhydrogenase subunit alpha
MLIAVPKETYVGERRVALVPAGVGVLSKLGCRVAIEQRAGIPAGFSDEQYRAQGAELVTERARLFELADIRLQVRAAGADPDRIEEDLAGLSNNTVVVAMCDPLANPRAVKQFAEGGATLFAMELIPRITRAQSMDVLSSMATISGYKAVLLAADRLAKLFPLLMTAAGTLTPAKVLVVGAGVAGLQAIATARRLGAIVSAYDVRSAAKEQIQSLGAKFVEMHVSEDGEGAGGYAKEMGAEFYQQQQALLEQVVADSDVVITTAAIPGKPAPRLVSAEAVRRMQPGSVVVDLAAERGGNCELTKADQEVVENGVTILGPTNLSSEVATHASQMFSKNMTNFVRLIVANDKFCLNLDDEIVRETLVAHRGHVVHARVREQLGLEPLKPPPADGPPPDHLAQITSTGKS